MLVGIVLFIVVLGAIFFISRKDKEAPPEMPAGEKQLVLTEEELDQLVEAMSAPPDAKPTLSPKELGEAAESMTAPPDAKPSMTEDELEKLLQSMTAQ